MRKSSPRSILALFLGLWVALAPAIFAVPAGAIPVQMNMSGEAGPGGCDACPDGDAAQGFCKLLCLNVIQLATLTEAGGPGARIAAGHQPGRHLLLPGRHSTPDPAPPKAVSLL